MRLLLLHLSLFVLLQNQVYIYIFLKCWHKIRKRLFKILQFFFRGCSVHSESVVFLCSIVVISPELEGVSISLNIIIPFPEVCTVLFHGSVVSFYFSIVLWCIGRILIVFYMILFKELLYSPRIFSSLISSYCSNRKWNLGNEFRKECECRKFIMILKDTGIYYSTCIINSCEYHYLLLVSPRE